MSKVELRRRYINGLDALMWGTDYPHPEGLDDPIAWRSEVSDLPAADVEQIMSGNLRSLLAA